MNWIILGLILILVLENLLLLIRIIRVNGVLHIDVYTNKDIYRMLYFTPLDKLRKHRRLVLKVETQQWNQEAFDPDEEDIFI